MSDLRRCPRQWPCYRYAAASAAAQGNLCCPASSTGAGQAYCARCRLKGTPRGCGFDHRHYFGGMTRQAVSLRMPDAPASPSPHRRLRHNSPGPPGAPAAEYTAPESTTDNDKSSVENINKTRARETLPDNRSVNKMSVSYKPREESLTGHKT